MTQSPMAKPTPHIIAYLDGEPITGRLTPEQVKRINQGFWRTWASIQTQIRHEVEDAILSLHYGAETAEIRRKGQELIDQLHRLAAEAGFQVDIQPTPDGLVLRRL